MNTNTNTNTQADNSELMANLDEILSLLEEARNIITSGSASVSPEILGKMPTWLLEAETVIRNSPAHIELMAMAECGFPCKCNSEVCLNGYSGW